MSKQDGRPVAPNVAVQLTLADWSAVAKALTESRTWTEEMASIDLDVSRYLFRSYMIDWMPAPWELDARWLPLDRAAIERVIESERERAGIGKPKKKTSGKGSDGRQRGGAE